MSKWCNNIYEDGIWISEEFDTKEDAIQDGIKQYCDALNGLATDLFERELYDNSLSNKPSGLFYVGEAFKYLPSIDAERIIETLQEDAYEQCGEVAEDFLDWHYINDEMINNLQSHLNKQLNAWLEKYNLKPSFSSIINVELIDANNYIK